MSCSDAGRMVKSQPCFMFLKDTAATITETIKAERFHSVQTTER